MSTIEALVSPAGYPGPDFFKQPSKTSETDRAFSTRAPGAPDSRDITTEQFCALLNWLDENPKAAGEKYEQIRRRLIRFFVSRGCQVSEDLTDETIDRVARKAGMIQLTYVGDPAYYFCRVASYVWLEYLRKRRLTFNKPLPAPPVPEEDTRAMEILENCLKDLPATDRELLLKYYSQQGSAKTSHRMEMAREFGLTLNALRIRLCRLRGYLHEQVELASAHS